MFIRKFVSRNVSLHQNIYEAWVTYLPSPSSQHSTSVPTPREGAHERDPKDADPGGEIVTAVRWPLPPPAKGYVRLSHSIGCSRFDLSKGIESMHFECVRGGSKVQSFRVVYFVGTGNFSIEWTTGRAQRLVGEKVK